MSRMQRNFALLLAIVLTAGCAGGAANVSPEPVPVSLKPEERLVYALEQESWSAQQTAVIAELQSLNGAPWVNQKMGEIVMDTTTSEAARVNALLHLGERHYIVNFRVYREGLRAREPLVRAATMVALGRVIDLKDESVVPLLRRGLRDPDINVQAKALQSLSDREPQALRDYLASDPGDQLRAVAEDLIQVAEERGAPLIDSASLAAATELSRVHSSGARVLYRAAQKWPQWQASVGALFVAPDGGELVHVADAVEVVGGVIPAFFSTDGRYLVYETDRKIRVRDLETGEDRLVASGSAPRSLPFTQSFVFMVERPDLRTESRDATMLHYAVMTADFAGAETPVEIAEVEVESRMSHFGAYAPIRVTRVSERDGLFFLEAPTMAPVALPSPFAQAS